MHYAKSKKVIETEAWVDEYILKHHLPPTYEDVATQFKISSNTAWYRCFKFREKMRQNKTHLNTTEFDRVLVRVKLINDELSKRGATTGQMIEFWNTCFYQCHKQLDNL